MDTIHITPKDDLQNILSNITRPTTIYLKKGVYSGKYVIAADNVKIVGEEREKTIITKANQQLPDMDVRESPTRAKDGPFGRLRQFL